ncbi:transcriptional regulator domain-containing protein [Mesorhizobium sp. IMUNJ 23232]|uniref:transcriptional regulator domain-containing protein n=1 Tax=Mesorhizobium sp. IMUNJ 23232 TaxID=3376064 RepID=UPI0037BC018D
MSQPRDWSDPTDWVDMLGYEPSEFAAEFLLRNEQFAAECSALLERRRPQPGELIGTAEFARRWGLRFHRPG